MFDRFSPSVTDGEDVLQTNGILTFLRSFPYFFSKKLANLDFHDPMMDPRGIFGIFTSQMYHKDQPHGSLGPLGRVLLTKNPQLRDASLGPNQPKTPWGRNEAVELRGVFWLEKRIPQVDTLALVNLGRYRFGWRNFWLGNFGMCVFFCLGGWADIYMENHFEQKS